MIAEKPIILTANEIKNLGSQLSDTLFTIEVMSQLSAVLTDKKDNKQLHLYQTVEALTAIYNQLGDLFYRLDKIAFKLLNCDDPEELEAMKKYE